MAPCSELEEAGTSSQMQCASNTKALRAAKAAAVTSAAEELTGRINKLHQQLQ